MNVQRPTTAAAAAVPVLDQGSYELGFRNKPSRRRDSFLGPQPSARPSSSLLVEASRDQYELPRTAREPLAPTLPTRHNPWTSDVRGSLDHCSKIRAYSDQFFGC
jgi:hypothetical protein